MENRTSMDFTNRVGAQPAAQPNQQPGVVPPNRTSVHKNKDKAKMLKWGYLGLGALVLVLVVSLILAISLNRPKTQSSYIYSNKLQAVFLNTGQVYFGNVQTINQQFLVLTNIFYLQTNSGSSTASTSTSNSNVSLVKLGCELHAPYDQMVINMAQVTFWENLQSTGQVAKAVAQYQKEYPHGQVCSNQSTTAGATTGTVQNAPTSTTKP